MTAEQELEGLLNEIDLKGRRLAPFAKGGIQYSPYRIQQDLKTLKGFCQNAAIIVGKELRKAGINYLPLGFAIAGKSGTHTVIAIFDEEGDIT